MTTAPPPDRRVGFVLAGVQKAGTTSLFAMVAEHPQVARPSTKELHFFDRDKRDWVRPGYAKYERKFTWTPTATIAGESTPAYVFWPGAMERIQAYNPAMRIILAFRDPVERAFSQWCMEKDRRTETRGFAESIRAVCPTRWPRTAEEAGLPRQAFVGRGYYGDQLERVLDLFPREQVLALSYHDMFEDVGKTLDRITDLLGVERFPAVPPVVHERAQPTVLDADPPGAEDVELLVDLFAADLRRFGELSGIDVTGWPTAQVAAGRRTAADLAATLATRVTFVDQAPADALRRRHRRDEKLRRKADAAS